MAGSPPAWVTKARAKEARPGARPQWTPRCRHCLVWTEGAGEYVIRCFHCSTVTQRIPTIDDAAYIARKCRETRVAHSRLCQRLG